MAESERAWQERAGLTSENGDFKTVETCASSRNHLSTVATLEIFWPSMNYAAGERRLEEPAGPPQRKASRTASVVQLGSMEADSISTNDLREQLLRVYESYGPDSLGNGDMFRKFSYGFRVLIDDIAGGRGGGRENEKKNLPEK